MTRSKIFAAAISICFSCPQVAVAQPEFEFSGYVVNLPIYQRTQPLLARLFRIDEDQFVDLSRLRLRPSVKLGPDTRIAVEYEVASLYLSSPLFFPVVTDKTNHQLLDLSWNPVRQPDFLVNHTVDRAYLKHIFSFGDLVLGRQRISWGTGRIWNPTDLFNPINPANFGKLEKDGADAASFKWYLGSFTDLTLVYNARERFGDSNAAFRFRTNVGEYDFSVMGGRLDERIVVGGDFAGNLAGAGVRGEGIISAQENDTGERYARYILGVDYQFTSKLYALVEYQHNGEGDTDPLKYDLARLALGEILNLSRDYTFLQSSYQAHPLVTTSLSWNHNWTDGSGFLAGLISYSVSDNSALALGGQYFFGEMLEEYWYYPQSVYLKAEFHF